MSDVSIDNGGFTVCGPGWNSNGWITEPSHKLYIVSEGGCGRYAIPGHEITLRPEHVYLIPGGHPQRYGPAEDMRVHWLHLRILSPAVERRLADLDRIREWPLAAWQWWQPVWESIPSWMETRDLPGEMRLHALVGSVFADALMEATPAARLDPRLEEALRWMDLHCRRHPPLEAVARVAGLAPAVFHRRFTAAVGVSPRSWLEARRLDHASRLLREPGATVQTVSAACGYANPFHFSRVMRRRLGASPSQVRCRTGP